MSALTETVDEWYTRIMEFTRHRLSMECPKCGQRMAVDSYPAPEQLESYDDEPNRYFCPSYWFCAHCEKNEGACRE